MEIDKDQSSIIIIKSLDNLSNQVILSNKDELEKEALKLLLEKIKMLYCKKIDSIDSDDIERIFNLQSYLTEVIADINNSIRDDADVFPYIDKINKKLKDQEISHLINKHKLLKLKLS